MSTSTSANPDSSGPLRSRVRALDPVVWWVAAATFCAAILWMQQLGAPLYLDEGASWYVASQPTFSAFWDTLKQQEIAPPPFYLGLRAVIDGLGKNGHESMRLPVVLVTLPVVPLAAVLARQIGARRFGIAAAAWLAALSPLLLQFGQQIRAYGPAAAAAMLAAVLLFHAADRGWTTKRLVAAAVALWSSPVLVDEAAVADTRLRLASATAADHSAPPVTMTDDDNHAARFQ